MTDLHAIFGLGNPGRAYAGTRHNIGFEVLDLLARRRGMRFRPMGESVDGYDLCEWERGDRSVILAKPRTYMNHSGLAVRRVCEHFGIAAASCAAVYDDADLEVGRLRLRTDGGHGGHNGVRSMIEALDRTDFGRIRLGVRGAGRDDVELADYVLQRFESAEQDRVTRLIVAAADAIEVAVDEGLEIAMNRFNGFRADAAATDN
ncbi:MAG: aminoacyl-tRNA hydrolase [Acidobacteriota bacterium]|nr:aminoacyl-tRNA hydrolase [Acidobacteriota bacterium]